MTYNPKLLLKSKVSEFSLQLNGNSAGDWICIPILKQNFYKNLLAD